MIPYGREYACEHGEPLDEPHCDPMPEEPWTELGYAHRLVHVYGDRLRYVGPWKQWLTWDGRRWAIDLNGQAARYAKDIARRVTTTADDNAALGIARRGESSAGIAGALTLASTDSWISVMPDDLDADPFLLNVANGTLDLRTGNLHSHNPNDLLTKLAPAAARADATAEHFHQFLARVQPDAGMRSFLARLIGHALEGRVTTHVMPIFFGDGANGKGTFINGVLAALGDYADAADPDLLTARTFDAHPTGVADLFGLRLAVLHEGDEGRRLAEGTVKRLTGGDRLKARRMRENFWSFEPSHTFVCLTNHKPIVAGNDEGIWRRLRLIPWDVVVPAEERDEELGGQLALEIDGILKWLVAGYMDWRANGLGEPTQVIDATNAYRSESDALGRFLDQRCLTMAACHVGSTDLYTAWAKWCADEGEDPGTQKAFSTGVEKRGYEKRSTRTGQVWAGIGLAADETEDRL